MNQSGETMELTHNIQQNIDRSKSGGLIKLI
jgi:hypothetical protein